MGWLSISYFLLSGTERNQPSFPWIRRRN